MAPAEQALRPEHQEDHQHHHAEGIGVGESACRVRKICGEEILGLAQHHARDDAAGDRAHAAEDHDDIGVNVGEHAHVGRQREDRRHQRARRGGERRADAEGEGVEAARIDAHDRRGVARLAHRIERLSPDGPLHEIEQTRDQRDADTGRDQAVIGQDQIADPRDPRNERGRLQRKGAEGDDGDVPQEVGETEGDNEAVLVLALGPVAVERRQQQTLEEDRQHEKRDHRHHHCRQWRKAQELDHVVGEVAPEHIEVAVSEIDDLQNGKDERHADGDHRVDRADDGPVGDLYEEIVPAHRLPRPPRPHRPGRVIAFHESNSHAIPLRPWGRRGEVRRGSPLAAAE